MRGAIIGAAIFIFMFFAGMAQARLGYNLEGNKELYGEPDSSRVVGLKGKEIRRYTWSKGGITTSVEFDLRSGLAVGVFSFSKSWTERALQDFVDTNTATFGEPEELTLQFSGDKSLVYISTTKDKKRVAVGTINRKPFTRQAFITIKSL